MTPTGSAKLWIVGGMAILAAACHRPLDSTRQPTLQETVENAIARELAVIETTAPAIQIEESQTPPDDVLARLAPRRAELEAIGPLGEGSQAKVDLGPDLTGERQGPIEIGLTNAVQSAVNQNLAIQASRLQPQITAEQVIQAEAVFDAVLFANADMAWIDEPQAVPVLLGNLLGTPFNRAQDYRFETGVRKQFSPGTELFVSTDLTRFRNLSPGITFFPDPAYTAAVRAGVNQPLLRGFGSDYNTATIRIARNEQRRTSRQLEVDLQQIVQQTENAYWDLHTAWGQLAIAQWLVDVGVKVRQVLEARQDVDATPAQYSDAVARIKQRQADVIRAQRQVRAASDALKQLMNDPQIPVSSEAVLRPADAPLESPVAVSLREAVLAAAEHRPEIQQAALDIEDASIRQSVASNERLPLLNLSAQAAFYGLDDEIGGAYSNANDGDFIDYLLGLAFEWPLGNRAADAGYRAARLQRSAATLNYQRTVQSVVLEVKNALRDMVTNVELIRATRSFRVAQAENLRTLEVEKEFIAALTPEFLNLEFMRQETLAQARLQEVRALADFNKSLAALYRTMGTGLRMRQIHLEVIEDGNEFRD